jgi:transposase-like protein
VETESRETWEWFIHEVIEAHPHILLENMAKISDRAKGLSSALEAKLPEASHRDCAIHLYRNVLRYCGRAVAKKCMGLVYAFEKEDYEEKYQCIIDMSK